MKWRVLLSVVGIPVITTGCVETSVPAGSSAPWNPPANVGSPDVVWQEMRSPKIDFSKPLTLAELTDLALQNNPASRSAWANARAAAAGVEKVKGLFLPAVTATADVSRQKIITTPDDLSSDAWKISPGLKLNYLIVNFGGGRKAAIEEALQTVYAADFAFNRSLQDCLLFVETAYYGFVSAEEGVRAAEANVKEARAILDASRDRETAGLGTELEALQGQAGYDQALYLLAGAQGQFKIARGNLALAIGHPADTVVTAASPAADVPEALALEDVRKLVDEAIGRRPDVAALRATLAAKKAAVKVAGSTLWPSLYLNGSVQRDYYDILKSPQPLPNQDWSMGGGLSLQWPLFDGYQTQYARRAAAAEAESTEAQLRQAELAASGDVWSRYFGYETAVQKHFYSAAYEKSAAAAYALALDSYKAGLKGILDLLDAENKLAQARSQRVQSRQEVFTALTNLAYATGLLDRGGSMQVRKFKFSWEKRP